MAFLRLNCTVDCVKDRMDLLIAVPQKKHIRRENSRELRLGSFQQNYPLLFLLHDEASSPGELCAMTNIQRFADEAGVVVVMPQGLLSWYTDYAQRDANQNAANSAGAGNIENDFTEMRYGTYLLEMVEHIRRLLPVSRDRSKTYVGGVGMGGFGALKLAMAHPELFSAVFSIEGDTDLQWLMDHRPERREQFEAIFGTLRAEGENDLPARCAEMADAEEPPRILQIWSKEGAKSEMNRALAARLEGNYPGYSGKEARIFFDWDFVDQSLREALSWL